MAISHEANAIIAHVERSPEDKIKAHSQKLGSCPGLDGLIDKFPTLLTDMNDFHRYYRLKNAPENELRIQIEKVMAEDFDKSLPEGADINRRMVALKFDSLFVKPCNRIIEELGQDYAAILQKGGISDDILAWELFLKVDVCTKIMPFHETIIDQVCSSVFCSDLTLIQIKQFQQTTMQAFQAIYEELRSLNANFIPPNNGFMPIPG